MKESEREREREFVRLALAMCPEYGVTIYVKSYMSSGSLPDLACLSQFDTK